MKTVTLLLILCCPLHWCAATPAPVEAVGKHYSHEFLAACKPDELRCLWFLDFHPQIAIVTIFDQRALTVSSWREVIGWAEQGRKSAPLSSENIEGVTGITRELKEAEVKRDYFHCVFVAFWRGGKLTIFRFDRDGERGGFPSSISKLLKIVSDATRAKNEPNHPPEPTPTSVMPAAEQPSRRP